jgi:hypothetical protein
MAGKQDEKLEARREQLIEQAAAMGRSLIILTPSELIEMVQRLSGGTAAGATALSNGMHSLTATIDSQARRIEQLQEQVQGLLSKNAELEKANFGTEQWRDMVALRRLQLAQDAEKSREMWGLLKLGAMQLAPGAAGGIGSLLGLGAPSGGPPPAAPGAAVPGGAPGPAAPEAAAPVAEAAPAGQAGDLVGLVQAAIARLSPGTIDAIFRQAGAPNAAVGNMPTLLVMVQALVGCLEPATIGRVRAEVGPELMHAIFAAARQDAPAA